MYEAQARPEPEKIGPTSLYLWWMKMVSYAVDKKREHIYGGQIKVESCTFIQYFWSHYKRYTVGTYVEELLKYQEAVQTLNSYLV
jgi:hypothetical protein